MPLALVIILVHQAAPAGLLSLLASWATVLGFPLLLITTTLTWLAWRASAATPG